jgi:hypothetical protein
VEWSSSSRSWVSGHWRSKWRRRSDRRRDGGELEPVCCREDRRRGKDALEAAGISADEAMGEE